MFVPTLAETVITKGLDRSTGLTSGPLGRPCSLVSLYNRGGLALLMTELKSSLFRTTALTLTIHCHPFSCRVQGDHCLNIGAPEDRAAINTPDSAKPPQPS